MSKLAGVKEPHELISLEEAVERVKALEAVLEKFAQIGVVMANAKFNLSFHNRPDEPSGGYWINGVRNAIMKPADHLFFEAIDVYGQQRAEAEFCAEMERVAAVRAAAEESLKAAKH